MGVCCSTKKETEQLPTISGFLDNNIDLKFKVELRSFRGKKIAEPDTFIVVKFGESKEFKSDKIFDTHSPNYKLQEDFMYDVTTRR